MQWSVPKNEGQLSNSVLMNIEPPSIYKKKYRSMEKMGIVEVDDFDKVIFGIG